MYSIPIIYNKQLTNNGDLLSCVSTFNDIEKKNSVKFKNEYIHENLCAI